MMITFIQSVCCVYNRLQKRWDILQHFEIFLMNFALELKYMLFATFTPTPLINVDHFSRHYGHFVSGQYCAGGRRVVVVVVVGGGGGGCFTWVWDIQKFAKKRSSVPTVLQPIVVLTNWLNR